MPDTLESLRQEFETRLEAIPPGEQYAQLIAGLQAAGWGTPEMQAMLDALDHLQTFVGLTDAASAPLYQYIHGVFVSGTPLQQACVPQPPPPGPVTATGQPIPNAPAP